MPPQRLPIVNSDDGTWGDILRQYLLKEHYDDGTNNAANGGHKTITIRAGTASAGTAPLKFTSGTLLTTPEAGAIEFNSDKLYFTKTTGPTRQTVATYESTGSTGDIYYRDSSSNFVRLPVGSSGNVLSVASGTPSWTGTLSNISLDTSNTINVRRDRLIIVDDVDSTKKARFKTDAITTNRTRDYTLPDADTTLVGTDTTQTLTNKTFDANGTGNSITNLDVANFAGSAIVTEAEGLNSSDNDTSLPTTAAVKDYVDSSNGIEAITTSSSTSLMLTTSNTTYVYTGAASATWTLPPISGNTGFRLTIRNRGSGDVLLQRGGSDNLWKITSLTSTIVKPEATAVFINDGAYWVFSSTVAVTDSEFAIISDTSSANYAVFDVGNVSGAQVMALPSTSTTLVGHNTTQTLTSKTINLSNNTLSGTTVQFNAALSDGDFATLTGTETLTNKTLTSPVATSISVGSSQSSLNYIEFQKTAASSQSNLPRIRSDSLINVGFGNDLVLSARSTSGGIVFETGNDGVRQLALNASGTLLFGTDGDTNLFRVSANTLKTDDTLIVGIPGTVAGSAVTIDGTQTLSNKTISGSSNSLSNIPQSAVTNLTSDLASKIGLGTNAYPMLAKVALDFDSYRHTSTLMPPMLNDLAFNNLRGGSTSVTLNGSPGGLTNIDNAFKPDAAAAINSSLVNGDVIVITVTNHKITQYEQDIGILMSESWRANDVKIEVFYSSTWHEIYSVTNSPDRLHSVHYHTNTSNGITQIRYTLTNFPTTLLRIISLYSTDYDSDLLSAAYMTLGGGNIYGHISNTTDPTSADHLARKGYVDTGLAGKANTSHTHAATQISDSTSVGRSVLTAADAAAARAAIGAGTGDGDVTLSGAQTLSNKSFNSYFYGVRSGANVIRFNSDNNGAIDLGRQDDVASTPFIDFNSGSTSVDFDARIQASGGTGSNGGGTLNITAGTFTYNTAHVATTTGSQTLTNKTISGSSNTLSNIPQSAVTNLTTDLAGKASTSHTHTASQISDSTATGRSVLTAASTAAARSAIGAGTASTKADVGLGSVDNTSDATKWAASATITNKTISGSNNTITNLNASELTSGQIPRSVIGISDFSNLAAGSDFERSDQPWSLGSSWSIASDQAYSGTQSLKVSGAGGSCQLQGIYEVKPGDVFNVEFMARKNSTWNGTSGNSKLRFGTQTNSYIHAIAYAADSIASADTWTKLTGSFTVPAGTTHLTITLTNDSSAGSCWLDDIIIRRVNAVDQIPNLSADKITSGTLPVARGGTGATNLTGVVIGNGTSAFTTVTAPNGTIVGTTDTQTLANKTLTSPTINGNTSINGDLTVDNGTNTVINVISDDGGASGIQLYGSSQGTGYVEVGQSASHGGGMYYNGDGSPAFADGEANDTIGFYRKSASVRSEVFYYSHNSDDVYFNGSIYIGGVPVATTTGSQALTNKDMTSGTNIWPTFNQNTTGNAATATALQTARTIGGVSFNGTANINLPGVNIAGNQNTSGNAATATTATNQSGGTVSATTGDFSTYARTNELRTLGGQQLVLNAGESHSYATSQTSELVYVNAENGLQINASPDNWSSAWAGRVTTIIDSSGITWNGNAVWHTGNDGSGSGLDADLLDGMNAASSNTGSTIVARDGNGDFSARYINTSYVYMSHGVATRSSDTVFFSSTDNYIRKNNATGFKASLALDNVDNTSDATKNSATATLSNKRITPRVTTITSSPTPSFNTDSCDTLEITALATNITSMTSSMSGSPANAQKLMIRIKDNGSARSITWGASWRGMGVSLPIVTTANKTLYIGAVYNSTSSIWDVIAVEQEA